MGQFKSKVAFACVIWSGLTCALHAPQKTAIKTATKPRRSGVIQPSSSTLSHRFNLQHYRQQSRSTVLYGVFDDDLPNILGINPVEAAFIFGLLYYFFGSETIYEYAREAGRLFSTYAPVVKDVTMDLSKEFGDYFEENRERELMRKAGVDVDKVPRRTSNVIERFQEGMKAQEVVQEETTASTAEKALQSLASSRSTGQSLESEATGLVWPDVDVLASSASPSSASVASAAVSAATASAVTSTLRGSAVAATNTLSTAANIDSIIDEVGPDGMRKRRSKKDVLLAKEQLAAATAAQTANPGSTAISTSTSASTSAPLIQSSESPSSSSSQADGRFFNSASGQYELADMTTTAAAVGAAAGTGIGAGVGGLGGGGLGSQLSAAVANTPLGATLSLGVDLASSDAYVFPSDFADQPAPLATTATAAAATAGSLGAASAANTAGSTAAAGTAGTAGMSKFQLQMSGQWNQQVMTSASKAGLGDASFDFDRPFGPTPLEGVGGSEVGMGMGMGGSGGGGEGETGMGMGEMGVGGYAGARAGDGRDLVGGRGRLANPDDLPRPSFEDDEGDEAAYAGRFMMDPRLVGGGGTGSGVGLGSGLGVGEITADVPEDLSAYDMTAAFTPTPRPTASPAGVDVLPFGMMRAGGGSGVGVVDGVGVVGGLGGVAVGEGVAASVLAELDRDYLALRSRLVSLIAQQQPLQQPAQQPAQPQQSIQPQPPQPQSQQPQSQQPHDQAELPQPPLSTPASNDPLFAPAVAAISPPTTPAAAAAVAVAAAAADVVSDGAAVPTTATPPSRKYWPPGNRRQSTAGS